MDSVIAGRFISTLIVLLRYDYLETSNEKGKIFGKHCGGPYMDVNIEVNVTGNYARLKFHSDGDLEKRGFLLHFTAVPLPGKNKY